MYDFFDEIVCINLDISVDRKKHAIDIFESLQIPAKFFTATKHELGGMYGCFDSHIQILKIAYDRGLDNILVFEDDFLPTSSYSQENLSDAIQFMKNNQDWDIFYFGYSVVKDDYKGFSTILNSTYHNKNIVQYNPFCTHALCYNKKAIEQIVLTYSEYIGIIHYDMFIASYCDFKNYCSIPMLFDQNFYFEHNNESNDCIEYIIRSVFPILAFTKINYRISVIRYLLNIITLRYQRYIHLFITTLLLYFIKQIIIARNKVLLKKCYIHI